MKNLIYSLIPPFFKALVRYKAERASFNRFGELEVNSFGLNSENIPFIELSDGTTLHGYLPNETQRAIYKYLLPKEIKIKCDENTVGLALDIVKRYLPPVDEEMAVAYNRFTNLKEGDVIVESGAFIGLYSMHAANLVGAKGKVIAIEAIEENYKILCKNLEVNSITNIIPIHKALWSESKTMEFYRTEKQVAGFSNDLIKSGEKYPVQADTLDHIIAELNIEKVDFIRLQINGAELEGIKGMIQTLKHKPQLLIAVPYVVDSVDLKSEIDTFLKSLGYETKMRGASLYAF